MRGVKETKRERNGCIPCCRAGGTDAHQYANRRAGLQVYAKPFQENIQTAFPASDDKNNSAKGLRSYCTANRHQEAKLYQHVPHLALVVICLTCASHTAVARALHVDKARMSHTQIKNAPWPGKPRSGHGPTPPPPAAAPTAPPRPSPAPPRARGRTRRGAASGSGRVWRL